MNRSNMQKMCAGAQKNRTPKRSTSRHNRGTPSSGDHKKKSVAGRFVVAHHV